MAASVRREDEHYGIEARVLLAVLVRSVLRGRQLALPNGGRRDDEMIARGRSLAVGWFVAGASGGWSDGSDVAEGPQALGSGRDGA